MPLQSRIRTVRVPGEGWLTPRDRAPTPSTGGSSPGEDPSGVHDRRFGMTRRVTGQRAGCPFLPEPRSTSGMCLQLHARGLKRMIAAQQSQSCLVPCSTTGFHLVPPGRSGCRQVGFMPSPRVIHPELAPPFAAGYKTVTFAGVFVPQVWNRHRRRSASRNRPVGCRFRLYRHVPGPQPHFDSSCVFLYTSGTSPKTSKISCPAGQGPEVPPSGAFHHGLPTARLNDIQDDTVPYEKRPPATAQEQGGRGVAQLSACRSPMGTTNLPAEFIDEPPHRGLAGPSEALTLILAAGLRPGG